MLGSVVPCANELQHHLVADQIFPAKVEDKLYFDMASKRVAHRLQLRAQLLTRRKKAKDPGAPVSEVGAATQP